ncbi:MAG: adenylyltransferase/cytidyltransferase family protein [bacterium]
MKPQFTFFEADLSRPTVVTIGTFDGVHLGHQQLLKQTIKVAKELNFNPLVLTFNNHPRKVLNPTFKVLEITQTPQKVSLIQEFGIANVAVLEFTKEMAELTADHFVKNILIDTLKMKHLVVGFDFSLGKNRQGDINYLSLVGQDLGFEVTAIDEFKAHGTRPSSGLIRSLLEQGKTEEAETLLGWKL